METSEGCRPQGAEARAERTSRLASAKTGVKKPAAPNTSADSTHQDSGAAWIILVLMFLINSSIGGASRVYGLIYAKQVAIGYYDHQAASWPIATASTVENLAGILTPALAQFLTWRQIQLISTSLFVLANLGAYFSSSLALDILCLGLVQGLALSMATVLTLAINNDYFERYRNTAYGLMMCGSTCGILYMGPLIGWTLESKEEENFRQAYLILALIFACTYPLAYFIVPRSSRGRRAASSERQQQQQEEAMQAAAGNLNRNRRAQARRSRLESHFERKQSVASISIDCKLRRQSTLSRSSCDWLQWVAQSPGPETHGATTKRLCSAEFAAEANPRILNAPMGLKRKTKPSQPAVPTAAPQTDDFSLGAGLRLLRCPYLHCVWLMLALYFLVSRVFIIVLADFAADRGIGPADSARLLNYWSLGELSGRILLSSFVDLRWVSVRSCVTATCGSLGATIALLVQLDDGYYLYAGCLLLVAALASLEFVLINVLIVEYLGPDQVTLCYSLGSLIAAAMLVGRPVLIGLFRDQLGSYDGLLLLLGAFSLAFALLFAVLEPLAVRRWPKASRR